MLTKRAKRTKWLHEIFWICAAGDIEISSEYIASPDNVVADTLSRIDYPCVSKKLDEIVCNYELCCKLMLTELSRSQAQQVEDKMLQPTSLSHSPIDSSHEENAVVLL